MDLVTVASFSMQPEAQLAKNLLESEEIPAVLSEEVAGDMLHLGGEIKLMVPQEFVERRPRTFVRCRATQVRSGSRRRGRRTRRRQAGVAFEIHRHFPLGQNQFAHPNDWPRLDKV